MTLERQSSFDGRNLEIIEFAEKYLAPFRLRGEEIIPLHCPFCEGGRNHDRDTFSVNMYDGGFNCMRGTCMAKGGFAALFQHFGEGVAGEHRRKGRSVSFSRREKVYVVPQVELLPLTDQIVNYFARRKISRSTLEKYRVAASTDGNIIFPFYHKDRLIYVKHRHPWKPREHERKEWAERNTQPMLFGMDECSFSQPLVICEGMLDSLSLVEAGVPNAVSVPSGVNNFDWVSPCWDFLEGFKGIILFGDNDAPGKEMVETLIRRLGEDRCHIITEFPMRPDSDQECKDINEILYFYGPEKLREMVENAEPVPVKGIIDLGDVIPIDPTTVPRIKTGIPALDASVGGLFEGDVWVLSGSSGGGKSTLSGTFLLNAVEQGKVVCAYSGELSKERFQQWINLQAAGSDYITTKFDPIRDRHVPFVDPQVQKRIRDWYRGKFFLFDNTEVFDTDEQTAILKTFSVVARRHGATVFLVDNLMTSIADSEDDFKAQGAFVSALKRFAKRFKAAVILVAHPRKTKAGDNIGKDDVSGNSAIVNLCDTGITVQRPDIRIIKNREEGLERLIPCAYAPDSRRIYQADMGDLDDYSWDKTGIEKANPRADSLPDYQVQLSQNGTSSRQPF